MKHVRGCTGLVVAIFLGGLTLAQAAPRKAVIAALGDSITAAAVANINGPHSFYENHYTLSWSTGREIDSQYIRLQDFMARNGEGALEPKNYAVVGVKTDNIPVQARQLALDMMGTQYSVLKYVTLLIGANDLCGSRGTDPVTPDEDFRGNLMSAFDILAGIPQSEPIRVTMSSIPVIPDLGKPEIQNAKTTLGFTCRYVRDKLFRFCNRMIEWKTEEEYAANVALVEHTNELLRSIAEEAMAKHPKLVIHFSSAMANWKIEPHLLAADCFHPSREGQQIMSQEMWDEQPFFQ
jgi:lysophospholipase L1-like esterase